MTLKDPCPTCGYVRPINKAARRGTARCNECAHPREHGTRRGYAQHKAEGSQACDACLEARREYDREWREKNLVRRCVDCGERGAWKSLRNRCPACHRIFEDIALMGGEWVNDRGIQRWVWRVHA